jgi:hypothetical protein
VFSVGYKQDIKEIHVFTDRLWKQWLRKKNDEVYVELQRKAVRKRFLRKTLPPVEAWNWSLEILP